MKLLILLTLVALTMNHHPQNDVLRGAWQLKKGTEEIVWMFTDGYSVATIYDKANRKFVGTWGGPYAINGNELTVQTEFNTTNDGMVGKEVKIPFAVKNGELTAEEPQPWKRLDNGTGDLAGNWHITGRLQDGKLVEIQRTGTRKTLKLLSGTRFQWVAIDPAVKGFYGTGGGTYTFANGKYTENIEFFSRDSNRVGASLTFDGKVENGAWMHSGLNSRGEPLNEVWRRVK
jgi:hypothetical protein